MKSQSEHKITAMILFNVVRTENLMLPSQTSFSLDLFVSARCCRLNTGKYNARSLINQETIHSFPARLPLCLLVPSVTVCFVMQMLAYC